MSHRMHVRKSGRNQLHLWLVALSLLSTVVAGCAPVTAQPIETTAPASSPTLGIELSVAAAWETFIGGQGSCVYVISYPSDMESGTLGWQYSWILRYYDLVLPPPEVANNFIYVSALPNGAETGGIGVILNYEPAAVETLQQLEIGESTTLRSGSDPASESTYTRLPDKVIANQVAHAYENTELPDFPMGTREIRYFFQDNDCAYLIGAYLNAANSDQPGAITEEHFDQIVATFDLIP